MRKKLDTSPIFIIGAERSGTTLLRLMLTSHPEISIPAESMFMDKLYSAYRGRKLSKRMIPGIIDEMFEDIKFKDWKLTKREVTAKLSKLPELTLGKVIEVPYRIYARKNRKKIWGDKNPIYAIRTEMIADLYPDARVIHIMRDGKDSVISMLEQNWDFGPFTVIEAAERWVEYVDSAQKFLLEHPAKTLEVKYEELVSDPVEIAKRITKFLGVKYDSKMMDYYKENKKKNLIPVWQRIYHKNTYKPITRKRIGRGLKKLTAPELFDFQVVAIDTLHRNEYALYSVPSKIKGNQEELYSYYKQANIAYSAIKNLESVKDLTERVENGIEKYNRLASEVRREIRSLRESHEIVMRRTSPRWWMQRIFQRTGLKR